MTRPITRSAPIFDEIVVRLKNLVEPLGVRVEDEFVDANDPLEPLGSGAVETAVILNFGVPEATGYYDDIADVRGQLEYATFEAICIAGSPSNMRNLVDVVKDALEGFAPNNGSEILMTGGDARLPVESFTSPRRYVRVVGFMLTIGTETVS